MDKRELVAAEISKELWHGGKLTCSRTDGKDTNWLEVARALENASTEACEKFLAGERLVVGDIIVDRRKRNV